MLDEDKNAIDGSLTEKYLQKALNDGLGLPASPEETKRILNTFDEDGNGLTELEEFFAIAIEVERFLNRVEAAG